MPEVSVVDGFLNEDVLSVHLQRRLVKDRERSVNSAERFTRVFKQEHREIRDAVLNLIQALRNHDQPKVRSFLTQVAQLTGPHFRYEEEAIFPDLSDLLDEKYVETLFINHDLAIGAVERLTELAIRNRISEQENREATTLCRSLINVLECDELSIMMELLPEEKILAVLAARERCRDDDLDLITWAEDVRRRKHSGRLA
jgi:hypothetical protein